MADITVNVANAGRVQADNDTTLARTGNVAFTGLQAVFSDATTGKLILSDASVAGTAKFEGVAIYPSAADAPVTLLKEGALDGLDVSGMSYGDEIFLSDNPGLLADAAGVVSVIVGKVILLNGVQVPYFDAQYNV